jgi:hypothetical protein
LVDKNIQNIISNEEDDFDLVNEKKKNLMNYIK